MPTLPFCPPVHNVHFVHNVHYVHHAPLAIFALTPVPTVFALPTGPYFRYVQSVDGEMNKELV